MSALAPGLSAITTVCTSHLSPQARPPRFFSGGRTHLQVIRASSSASSSSSSSSPSSSATSSVAVTISSGSSSSFGSLKNNSVSARNPAAESSGHGLSDDLEVLPSGERVTPWWRKGPKLNNVVDVHSTQEFVAHLYRAANVDRKNGRARLVCVEYFAGWCFACRALHPKLDKIAEKEFPNVLFLRVHKDELPDLCEALGIDKLPYTQLFKGVHGIVDGFAMNNSAPNLAKFRRALATHEDGKCQTPEEQAGPASTVHTKGWPEVYTATHRRSLRKSAFSFYRDKSNADDVSRLSR